MYKILCYFVLRRIFLCGGSYPNYSRENMGFCGYAIKPCPVIFFPQQFPFLLSQVAYGTCGSPVYHSSRGDPDL